MEETGDALLLGELVVEAHRFFGLQDVRRNALVLKELQGFRADLQCLEDRTAISKMRLQFSFPDFEGSLVERCENPR